MGHIDREGPSLGADDGAAPEEGGDGDAADEGPGWSCGTAMGAGGGALITGWVPGARPRDFGTEVGMPMSAGGLSVMSSLPLCCRDAPAGGG